MREFLYSIVGESDVAKIIISVALMMFCGFLFTRVTKLLKLPSVTAYILAGITIGPYALDLIPESVYEGMDFIADIALAFIAFGTGEFFKFDKLRANGLKTLVVTVCESLAASFFVFCVMRFALGLDLAFSVVLGALAAATAPASTVMTIRQTGAHGDFVDTLLQVVALDDVVGLVGYSIAVSLALSFEGGSVGVEDVLLPIVVNAGVFVLGGIFGYFLKLFIPQKRSTDNRLIISLAFLFLFCGVCAVLDVSPLLGCMSMGTVYINVTKDEKLFKQLNYFSPPVLLLFFVRSGVGFRLDTLFNSADAIGGISLAVVGVVYFVVRICGKYAGAWLGCRTVKKERAVRNYLGFALIPQAGVAIGLATLCARTLGGSVGNSLQTIILSSSVLYELVGPACAKFALWRSHSYDGDAKNETEKERVLQTEISVVENTIVMTREEETELAFTEAATEHFGEMKGKTETVE